MPQRNQECATLAEGPQSEELPHPGTTVSPPRWSSSAAPAHSVAVSILTSAEMLIGARRLAGARPHLTAVPDVVHHEDLRHLCRDQLRRRHPRRRPGYPRPLVRRRRNHAAARDLPRGQTIPRHVIIAQTAPRERRSSR
jgi:hypothetical protein